MSATRDKLECKAEKLRAQLAAAQATVDELKAKLSKIEGTLAGDPTPATGLDMLWKEAPPMARTCSSKYKCRVAWNRIPPAARPRVPEILAALRAWKRCYEWKREDGQFVPALDRWIKERRWEDWPEDVAKDPMARYRNPAPPKPAAPTEEDKAAIAEFLKLPAKALVRENH